MLPYFFVRSPIQLIEIEFKKTTTKIFCTLNTINYKTYLL